ncbi:hypothetical protein F511_35196 [Dorcoceras hygrometricum]|uniref:Uncharacterized protein n=1 Tax=Dorcoceras hygrometricum TaxID=472368 RepID=A0A2Z7AVL3_9LAMI|nr:hypothetical protein F511_35196 [Dorcoceras hygrometricum]
MAALSNRSPSPIAPRPSNLNPSSRNQENNPATRKSLSGNNSLGKPSILTNLRRFDPVTPANSPSESSDFARRSVGKESCVGSFLNVGEEKENDEKDMNSKAAKLRSPGKVCKNFMSPTISAASKFTPSPRKKVLAERNDPVRTSMSLSDGKAMFFSTSSSTDVSETFEPTSDLGFDQNHSVESFVDAEVSESQKNVAIPKDPAVSRPLKKVTFLDAPTDSESVNTDSDENLVESSLKNKISCSDVSPSIAPLDADPSMPPYDPKTNYLSPRPQFLYYKPNPRIDVLLNRNSLESDEFMQLEDDFTDDTVSETISDSERTEESQAEDLVVGVTEMEGLSPGIELPESLPVGLTSTEEVPEDSVPKIDKKPRGFSRLIFGSMFLIFLIACASIYSTHSPVVDEFVSKNSGFSDFSDLYYQSKDKFDWVARHINQFQVDSLSFISALLGEGESVGPLQFMNLTDLQKRSWNEEQIQIHQGLMEDLEEVDELEELAEEEEYAVDTDERFDEEIEEYDSSETEEISPSFDIFSELEPMNSETIEGEIGVAPPEDDQLAAASYQDQENKFEAKDVEMEPDFVDAEYCSAETDVGPSAGADVNLLNHESSSAQVDSSDEATVESSPVLVSPPQASEEKHITTYIIGISSVLLTVAAVLHFNKKKPSLANVDVSRNIPFIVKKLDKEFAGTEHISEERRRLSTTHTEFDLLGGSCPSEISSFQKSYKHMIGANEVQSLENKPKRYSKRESLASSSGGYSTGSPSYGSFTTYERIPTKHVNRDEDMDVITPVRRSSRLRNQITSP